MQQLTLPGIEFAPVQARRHGLCEFHTYPLVSPGKDAAGVWRASFRVPAVQAWTFPELELGRPGNSIPALLFDLDGDPTDWLARVGEYMAAQRPSFCSLTLLTILILAFSQSTQNTIPYLNAEEIDWSGWVGKRGMEGE